MVVESTTSLKTCSGCRALKPPDDFNRDASQPDGLKSDCKECRRLSRERHQAIIAERDKRYREQNPDTVARRNRRYKEQNRDKVAARWARYRERTAEHRAALTRQWRRDHPEQRNLADRRWRANNPEKARAWTLRNNHRRRAVEGAFTTAEWVALCARYGNRCLCCGSSDRPLTPDHVIPISRGGTNWIADIQPLCLPCNQRKGTKTIDYR